MYKLLLVDDEQIIREGLESMIDWEGLGLVKTASCANAISALDSMMDETPDILLTDVRMPGMDGLELVERAMALQPKLQAIILSGYDTFEYAQQAIKSGVIEYLLKPCSQEELTHALERACAAIDKERNRTLRLYGQRRERVKLLVEKLGEIRETAQNVPQTEEKIHALVSSLDDVSLLKEALISLVSSSAVASQTEWGMHAIMDALKDQTPIEALVAQTLTRLRTESGGGRGFVQQMVSYVENHYMEEALSLQYLADNVVYMNADYIGREFSRTMGCKFSAYLLETRMERAKLLMSTTLHSYEIAELVGLGNNPHYFSQVFRKYTGMTPKEYRTEMEKTTEK